MTRRTLRIAIAALGLLLLGGALLQAGCTRRAGRREEPRPRVDRSLMACLGAMRAYHRQADVHLARGDTEAAVRAVEQILALQCIDRKNPEVQEVVLDAYGRLGRLHLKLGQLDQAEQRLGQGLARPGPPTFFRANLLMVRGDLLDAKAEAKDRGGDKAAGDTLRRQAIQAFEQSAKMNKELLEGLVK